jgi:peptidase E
VPAEQPTILATSGGLKPGARTRLEFDLLLHHAVELAGVSGRAPRVTHLGTAGGDQRAFNAELGSILRTAWQEGVILAGVSAGSICWFQGGTTDSFGPELRAVGNGLALLPYANGVHYDSEARRRPLLHQLVADGTLGETHCTDDGVGLVYHGTSLVEAVSEIRDKGAYKVTCGEDGDVLEEMVEPRYLG